MELRDLSARLQIMEKRQRWMTAALALVVFIAVGWPIALAGYAVLHGVPFLKQSNELAEPAPPMQASETQGRASAQP
jgi:hypothetical protein